MRIVVFGATGQLARSLAASEGAPADAQFLSRMACDLSSPGNVARVLADTKPNWIVNAAAYTAVDKAESEPELAHQINAGAVAEMADYVANGTARLIHVSTDFVFAGAAEQPYRPGDPTAPTGVYGESKLAGEGAIIRSAPEDAMIIRTSWVYSEFGSNFVKTMLKLMSERDSLAVVDDQRGAPTYAGTLASHIWRIIADDRFAAGIYHWSDRASITWHEFAMEIQRAAIAQGILSQAIPIEAIPAEQYPTAAERPAYSVLDVSKFENLLAVQAGDWQSQLTRMLAALNRE